MNYLDAIKNINEKLLSKQSLIRPCNFSFNKSRRTAHLADIWNHHFMSVLGHKRKRSLQETTVGLSKMKMASNCLDSLKEELVGIDETEYELNTVMKHVAALEAILNTANKPRINFSVITSTELAKLGAVRKRLGFCSNKIRELTETLNPKARAELPPLRARLLEIYEHVNMDYASGSRMVLDAVLLALAQVVSDAQSKTNVAIFPGMRLAPADGVQVTNPASGYEVWLTGSVNYAIIQYEDVSDNKDRLLGPGGCRDDAFDFAEGCLLLVQAKHNSLTSSIPEAVSQAIALAKATNLDEVRFCLSDGQTWIFFILKGEDGRWIYYESGPRQLTNDALMLSDKSLREIVQLLVEWLTSPPTLGLYELQ